MSRSKSGRSRKPRHPPIEEPAEVSSPAAEAEDLPAPEQPQVDQCASGARARRRRSPRRLHLRHRRRAPGRIVPPSIRTQNRRAECPGHVVGAGDADAARSHALPSVRQGGAAAADRAAARGDWQPCKTRGSRRRTGRRVDASGAATAVLSPSDASEHDAGRTATASVAARAPAARPAGNAPIGRRRSAASRSAALYAAADAPERRTPARQRASAATCVRRRRQPRLLRRSPAP